MCQTSHQRREQAMIKVIITLTKNYCSDFAQKYGISNNLTQVLILLDKNKLDYTAFATRTSISNKQIETALAKSDQDQHIFMLTQGLQNSDFAEKYDINILLKQITPVDLRSEQENIINTLIKREIEIVIDRVLKQYITLCQLT
ncbi:Hypothetical_protein [Hexamita inflata]|uniref:Hypothetical_protein n=1 Tax=Hexamita inflata TaxID=28002 RepID=A0AA86NBP4_9EUKA|nr:Hypothetical protein HINF_LOCUS3724 [Hexamita inflata]